MIPDLPSVQLDPLALSDLEMFITGAYAPQSDFNFSSPQPFSPGDRVLLRDAHNVRLAVFTVDTADANQLSGSVEVIEPPRHPDYPALRHTPAQLSATPHAAIVLDGFITADTEKLIASQSLPVVVHVLVHGAVDHFARVRAVQAVVDPSNVTINILPLLRQDKATVDRVLRNCGAQQILTTLGGPYSPAVQDIVSDTLPPRRRQGFCIFFTGLPSAGKSTIADQLAILLRERGRAVTSLDGDVVRTHLSKGLGFSREDRDTNIRRIGFVAAELVKHHAAVICAAVSPFQQSRDDARRMMPDGHFILVWVATPPEVCEQRDVKGFYARARAGSMQGMTGVDDPYEEPSNAELILHTTGTTPQENAQRALEYLIRAGFVTR